MSTELQKVKQQLDLLKTNLSAAIMRRDEVMSGLQQNYGFETAQAAAKEQKKLREKTIPTLQKKRDGFVARAEGILNGLNTGADTGGNTAAQAGLTETEPASRGPAGSRTLVGGKRSN